MNNKLFNEILIDISALYEISLVNEPSLDIVKTADGFLKILMSRFGLGFSAVYMKHQHLPHLLTNDGKASLIYSYPTRVSIEETLIVENSYFKLITNEDGFYIHNWEAEKVSKELIGNRKTGSMIIYSLADIGFLVLYSLHTGFFNVKVGKKLKKVIDKLARNLASCLAYARLKLEIEKRKETEQNLINIQNQLEYLVATRTLELQKLNESLEKQIKTLKVTEEKINRQNKYMISLHDISLGLLNRLDINELLENIVIKAGELFNTPHGFLYLYSEQEQAFVRELGIGIYAQDIGRKVPLGVGLVSKVTQEGNPIFIKDYKNWSERNQDQFFENIVSVVHAPILVNKNYTGSIGLAFTEEGREFGDEELMILTRFAELASIAIDNAHLFEQLKYYSLHDPLTGLYNRTLFQQHMEKVDRENIPTTLIICDIDGLKLINDTMGHLKGDELLKNAAQIIKEVFTSSNSMIARIGGDEFAVLLPYMSLQQIEAKYFNLNKKVEAYNKSNITFPLSISIGYASKKDFGTSITDIFKEADNNLNREKLHHSKSNRSAVVQTLMLALEVRDHITEGHADRMQDMVVNLAKVIGLSERTIADLRLFARFHDIGKVGISDTILFKPGPLNGKERREMERHSEIGFRIAQSSPDLSIIADWILKHHEWWNGQGYPLQLKEREIPIECRILAIVDAFDAMTNYRPYREALTIEQAFKELKKCAGNQFDPELVEIFIDLINK